MLKLVKKGYSAPFLVNTVLFGVIGLIFISELSIIMFTDKDVSTFTLLVNKIVGYFTLGIAAITAYLFLKFKDNGFSAMNRQSNLANIISAIDHFLMYTLHILVILLVMRFLFGRDGEMGSLYPFYASVFIKPFSIWMPFSLILGLAWITGIWFFLRKIGDEQINEYYYLFYVFLGTFVLSVSLALTDRGPTGLTLQFDNPGMQYPEDTRVIAGMGVFQFIKSFNMIQPDLSYHSQGHPIGPSLFYYIAYSLFGYNNVVFALYTIFFGSLTVFPLFFLLKKLLGVREACYGIAIFMVTPNVLIFTATSFDIVILFFSCLTITIFYYVLEGVKTKWIVICAISLFCYCLVSFHSLVMGVFFLVLPLYYAKKKRSRKPIVNASLVAGISVLCFLIIYFMGYSYVESFFQSHSHIKRLRTDAGINLSISESFMYGIGNLMAFLIYLGMPTGFYLFRLRTHIRVLKENVELRIVEIFVCIILVAINVVLICRLEQERVWLFLVPFFILPTTKIVSETIKERQFAGLFYVFLCVSFVQAWIMQLTMDTVW